jgi:hypothetical protein
LPAPIADVSDTPKRPPLKLAPHKLPAAQAYLTATTLYPISDGTPLSAAVAACFVNRVEAKVRELAADPSVPFDAKRQLRYAIPVATSDAATASRHAPERVSCKAARDEIFTDAKKKAMHAEFLYPWEPLFPVSGRASWSGATECYRSYSEGGGGHAIYGARVGGQVVVLEIWFVPEVV